MPVISPILLFESECYRVERILAPSYLRVTRSKTPFLSQQHCNLACAPVQHVLDRLDRRMWGLLIDSRLAVGRNDDEYESWFTHHRRAMVLEFPRVCILMRTAIGKLQADRMLRVEGAIGEVRTSLDEAEAIRWLSTAPSSFGPISRPTLTESTAPAVSAPPVSMRRAIRRDRHDLSTAPPASTSSWTTEGIAVVEAEPTGYRRKTS